MQTLTTLQLLANKIGDQGAQHLANALRQNKVTLLSFILTFAHSFLQTLTTLDLPLNDIHDLGVQHLADALQENKVAFKSTFH
jgi:hypothetical protein